VSLPEGLLLLDKPAGITSHGVVDAVRKRTGQTRVGHAGTLDPSATGLLPIVLGRATRLVRFLPDTPKVYTGVLVLGLTTTTDDTDGDVLARWERPLPGGGEVLAAASSVRSATLQVPPAVSARKIDGERSYRLARRGERPSGRATPVSVTRFDLSPAGGPGAWSFVAEVSAGTYIRGLARDLGAALGCGGAVRSLRRIRIGPLDVGSSVPFPVPGDRDARLPLDRLIPLETMPLAVPSVLLTRRVEADRFAHGLAVRAPDSTDAAAGASLRVVDPDGRVLGIAELAAGMLRPRVVLPWTVEAP
jgi:tRNA pseudouridine55 synthase